jgi:hypothetical protein
VRPLMTRRSLLAHRVVLAFRSIQVQAGAALFNFIDSWEGDEKFT